MQIDVLTLFPEMFPPVLNSSILGRAQKNGFLSIGLHNIRDYAKNKHRQVDDYPFGGGQGMLMMPQPIFDCMEAVQKGEACKRIYMSPKGERLTNTLCKQLAQEERLIILSGHYEGVDQRVIDNIIDMEISIGDYITTGGELPAMVLIDSLSRFIPGILGSEESPYDESFEQGLLEYPQYTRPADYNGMKVPEILLGGHHANICKWQQEEAEKLTRQKRPDLLEKQRK